MARFEVHVTRNTFASGSLTVEAPDAEAADRLAQDRRDEIDFSTYDTEYEVTDVTEAGA